MNLTCEITLIVLIAKQQNNKTLNVLNINTCINVQQTITISVCMCVIKELK